MFSYFAFAAVSFATTIVGAYVIDRFVFSRRKVQSVTLICNIPALNANFTTVEVVGAEKNVVCVFSPVRDTNLKTAKALSSSHPFGFRFSCDKGRAKSSFVPTMRISCILAVKALVNGQPNGLIAPGFRDGNTLIEPCFTLRAGDETRLGWCTMIVADAVRVDNVKIVVINDSGADEKNDNGKKE